MTRAGQGTPLEDRAAHIMEASGGKADLDDLAAQVLKAGRTSQASAVLRTLLERDSRFGVSGTSVVLVRTLPQESAHAVPLVDLPLVFVDFETSGWETHDRAIEVGAACFVGGREVGAFETLLDPGVPPSPFVTRLTGITGSDLRGKPTFPEVWSDLAGLLRGRVVGAHNLPFDMGVLRRELVRFRGSEAFDHAGRVCTLRFARKLLPRAESRGLDAMAERFSLKFSSRHRALDDARVAGRLFYRLVELASQERELATWGELQRLLAPRRPSR